MLLHSKTAPPLNSPRLQEVNSMINKRLKDALFTDQWSELFMEALGPFSFVLVMPPLHLLEEQGLSWIPGPSLL